MSDTIPNLIGRALEAYADLQALGEAVEDEWSYVNDLADAWRARLEAVAAAHAGESVGEPMIAAVDRAAQEIGRIEDPHRAIDWLSTFPQVVLVTLGEPL